MNVVSSRKDVKAPGKRVEANQKAIDALPQASGTWRVEGVPGLYLRCRVRAKVFLYPAANPRPAGQGDSWRALDEAGQRTGYEDLERS